MDITDFLYLISNTLVLITVLITTHFFRINYLSRYSFFNLNTASGKISTGILLGFIGIAVMRFPLRLDNQLIFDAHFILISVASFFFIILITLICTTIISAWLLFFDGEPLYAVINLAVSIAIISVRFFWRPNYKSLFHVYFSDLFFYGFVTQTIYLFFILIFTPLSSLIHIIIPILICYPLITAFLAYFLNRNGFPPVMMREQIEDNFIFNIKQDSGLLKLSEKDPNKSLLTVNPYLCQLLGYSVDESQNLTWLTYTHPDDLDISIKLFNKLLSGEIDQYELRKRVITKEGKIIPILINVFSMRSKDNTIEILVTTYIDLNTIKNRLLNAYSN